jgi:hypothetical protein
VPDTVETDESERLKIAQLGAYVLKMWEHQARDWKNHGRIGQAVNEQSAVLCISTR